ncbi:MAG: ATP-grasp domain-containing protein [Dehalococcoidia bacterium]|jgi:predicted ATP-grasp superfamily ATP-dependent carboligase
MEKGTIISGSEHKKKPTAPACQSEQTGAVIIGGNFQGLGVLRSLAGHNIPTYLLDHEFCIGRFSIYTKKFSRCPSVRQESLFLQFLINLAKREKLNGWVIYPNDDETVGFLARNKEVLDEYYRLITPSWDIVKFAYDKRLTYELARKCDIAIPRTFHPANVKELEQLDIDFPVIIKPAIKEPFYSRTKKKAIRVDTRTELIDRYAKAAMVVNDSSVLMVQELIPGGAENLFSVGSLSRNGKLLARVVARRRRQHPMDFGHATTYAETVHIAELEEIARRILAAMGYYGLSEVEFMRDPRDEKYKLLEINPRPWGWHSIAIAAGVDLPYLSYQDMLGVKVEQDGFAEDIKWIRLTTDTPTVLIQILKGRVKLTDYLNSFRGKKEFATLSIKDPVPFIAELAMLPYLYMKKGF